ncbi:MAG: hypothetical protein HXY43_13375 [Fischerella sp.]|jgi:hypothetical protein|uniref:hypothetical protein n=1 Tax=Fischerella sp. TaxID=1191 RepID=UPI0017A8DB54|nr:hypothetical protein [Fischerella sp.]NWF60218.1 hypothetical protein [Fischerella sp.]
MTTTVISLSTPAIQLADIIDYSQSPVQRPWAFRPQRGNENLFPDPQSLFSSQRK